MQLKQRPIHTIAEDLQALSPVLQRVLAARGIESLEVMDKQLASLLPFYDLKNIDRATARLERALREEERILIVGDFDADGATSSALGVSALRAMGAKQVEFLVPNRFAFGYGLTPAIIDVAKQWHPHLIITVDNGISSIEGVEAAHAAGMEVLVTDHHLPGEILPNAYAIVNPNQEEDVFPSKCMAGVGVIFYVMLALRRRLSDSAWFDERGISAPNMSQYLDLVALGTVADVVPLDQNNRILVHQGLQRIRQGACRPGIKALIEISGRQCATMREMDLGFALAPRLNAAGRLDDMSLGIECLLCDNWEKAQQLALELDTLNIERRKIEGEMKEQAMSALDKVRLHKVQDEEFPVALCLMDPSWHQGVIGILAGRLKDRYHRPTIVFAKVSENELKGSARSVAGLNIRDVLAALDKDNPGLMIKFGGHAMAAGLSLEPKQFEFFQQALVQEVEKHREDMVLDGEILSDGPLQSHEIHLELASLLQESGPWGQHFPEPLFDNRFEILEQRIVGQKHLKLTLVHEEGGALLDAIAFNVDTQHWPNHRARFLHAVYKLDVNEFRGRKKIQLVIVAMESQDVGVSV